MTILKTQITRRTVSRFLIGGSIMLSLPAFFSIEQWLAPDKDVWDIWRAHNPASLERVDHTDWSEIAAAYVVVGSDGQNLFNYGGVTQADKNKLDRYTAALSRTLISQYTRAEQKAFWINFYNALTIRLVLEDYPVESIRHIDLSPGLTSDGPWDKALMVIEGEAITLNDIEHRILRPIWDDPRIHYALNCAAIGCPNLQPIAYTVANTEDLLNKGAREFINHPRGVSIESGNDLIVSSIYNWFEEDFDDSEEGVIRHLKSFADEPLHQVLGTIDSIDDYVYDWSLNDTARRP